jgi:hypothetical protein
LGDFFTSSSGHPGLVGRNWQQSSNPWLSITRKKSGSLQKIEKWKLNVNFNKSPPRQKKTRDKKLDNKNGLQPKKRTSLFAV